MATRGFWGIRINGKEKLIYVHNDSYPSGLGKDVIFAIQNGKEILKDAFDKMILVRNIDNLSEEEFNYIVVTPSNIIEDYSREKYFVESAKRFLESGGLEYGYVIDFDENSLVLYDHSTIIKELELDRVNYLEMENYF